VCGLRAHVQQDHRDAPRARNHARGGCQRGWLLLRHPFSSPGPLLLSGQGPDFGGHAIDRPADHGADHCFLFLFAVAAGTLTSFFSFPGMCVCARFCLFLLRHPLSSSRPFCSSADRDRILAAMRSTGRFLFLFAVASGTDPSPCVSFSFGFRVSLVIPVLSYPHPPAKCIYSPLFPPSLPPSLPPSFHPSAIPTRRASRDGPNVVARTGRRRRTQAREAASTLDYGGREECVCF